MVFKEKKINFLGKHKYYYYLVGAIKGDGCEVVVKKRPKNYGLRLYSKDDDFHEAFCEAISRCFDGMRFTTNYPRNNLRSTCLYGNGLRRIFHDDLKELDWIINLDDVCFCSLLRGFFDAEGSFTHQKSIIRGYQCNHQHLQIANTNYELMKLLRDECSRRKIAEFKLSVYPAHKSCFGKKDKVYLRMHKISGIKRFFELVGSNIRRKVPSYC
jgi:hypothetical protein